ncbi:DUF3667 domain-containing protein [Aquiflexum sp. LQ15W]|uniref:DUF3667 domain-containing protein n=1 Tax=Cognataquiflexum nitidum TaxID=2922272 RepID=UPI001F13A4E1|nr:DUF3667 domain-containing protein [Cognataquiflexum nitidum]MCH6200519.1 DUF3667 domain-containing protein [Cognataquiflexum nitidum]
MTSCKNCTNITADNFCSSCGNPANLKRIDRFYIFHEIYQIFLFEKGFFYNLKELSIHPGDSIKQFIHDNRSRHMKPVPYLILTSIIFTLVSHFFKANEKYDRRFESSRNIDILFQWINDNHGYANIIMGIITAFFVYLFFRKYQYNFFEIIVLLCFIVGQGMLLLTLVSCFYKITDPLVHALLMSFIVFIYAAWTIGQFFERNKVGNYLKGLLAYFLGYLFFYLLVVAVGLLIDMTTTGNI